MTIREANAYSRRLNQMNFNYCKNYCTKKKTCKTDYINCDHLSEIENLRKTLYDLSGVENFEKKLLKKYGRLEKSMPEFIDLVKDILEDKK